MGRALLVYRLAVRDLRHHAAQAALLVIAIAAATATLTMALSMNGVTGQPYAATRAATNGPDVVAYLTSAAQAKTLVHASGVTEFQRTLSGRLRHHPVRRPHRRGLRRGAQPDAGRCRPAGCDGRELGAAGRRGA